MMPILYLTNNLGTIIGVIISQFIGALLFWFIDRRIFKNERKIL